RPLAAPLRAPAAYYRAHSHAVPRPFPTRRSSDLPGSAVVAFSAMLGAFTVTLTGDEVVLATPLLAVKLKVSVTGAAPAATVGAGKEETASERVARGHIVCGLRVDR